MEKRLFWKSFAGLSFLDSKILDFLEKMIKLLVKRIEKENSCQVSWELESHKLIYIFIDSQKSITGYLYWRLADAKGKSLFNIDVDYHGCISQIEIISYNLPIFSIPDRYKLNSEKEFGNIIVSTEPWKIYFEKRLKTEHLFPSEANLSLIPEKIIDNPKSFKLQVNKKDMRIELFEDIIAREIWVSESLCFELNELGEICAIVLDGFMTSQGRGLKRLYFFNFLFFFLRKLF
ncbi:hypothetical protein [Lusitaniella coriacea]|uniref:hypothetical protein n=1 Tax=Lusitaniella coriacea TaxID=1983105 RepID=UPI003CF430E9